MMDAYTHLDMSASDPIADFQSRMASAGIDRALAVETWSGDNLTCLERLLDSSASQFRVALCFRTEKHLPSQRLLDHHAVIGLRVKTADLRHLGDTATLFESSDKWLVSHAENGIGPLTKALVGLAADHPRLRIYVPHLAWPRRDAVNDQDWQPAIAELSRVPGLVIGVSAIAHFSVQPYPHADVGLFASKVTAVFSADSIVAGSDYPLFEKDLYALYMALARDWIGERPAARPSKLEAACFSDSIRRKSLSEQYWG
jgi:predicted TIM-barrel fold metal-dependent hydrolase